MQTSPNTNEEYLPPEVEAALITAATHWAVFVVGRLSRTKGTRTLHKQVRDAFVDVYQTLYLNVMHSYPHHV